MADLLADKLEEGQLLSIVESFKHSVVIHEMKERNVLVHAQQRQVEQGADQLLVAGALALARGNALLPGKTQADLIIKIVVRVNVKEENTFVTEHLLTVFVKNPSESFIDHRRLFISTQTGEGLASWLQGQEPRKAPLLIDLRADPFEMAPVDSSYYDDWLVRRMFAFVPLQDLVANFMATFEEFPQRQEIGSFTPKQ